MPSGGFEVTLVMMAYRVSLSKQLRKAEGKMASEKSVLAYNKAYQRLKNRCARDLELAINNLSDILLARWMTSTLRPSVGAHTWRTYRNAVNAVAQDDAVRDILSAPALNTGRSALSSANRANMVTRRQIEELRRRAQRSTTETAMFAVDWLVAGVCTGLRPIEWTDAKMVDLQGGETGINCLTRKSKDAENAIKLRRTVPLTHLRSDDLRCVQRIQSELDGVGEQGYRAIYSRSQQSLRNLCRDCWGADGPAIALYTGRHQFRNNAKAAGLEREEIAVLLGQENPETHEAIYGVRHHASTHGAPTPIKPEVEDWKRRRQQ